MKMLSKSEFDSIFPKSKITDRLNSNQNTKVLLLGAGFSSRFNPNFTNKKILDTLINKIKSKEIYNKYSSFFENSFNVERILKDFYTTYITLKKLGSLDDKILKLLSENYLTLRELFIDSIIENVNHYPVKKHKSDIAEFLLSFDYIFSVSYDPVLYWSVMDKHDDDKYKLIHPKSNQKLSLFGDYFLNGIYTPEAKAFTDKTTPKTLLHYLHGNMFIYQVNKLPNKYITPAIMKISSSNKINEDDLAVAIRKYYKTSKESLKNYISPIVVSEGTNSFKFQQIIDNKYLNDMYNRFKERTEENQSDLCILDMKEMKKMNILMN